MWTKKWRKAGQGLGTRLDINHSLHSWCTHRRKIKMVSQYHNFLDQLWQIQFALLEDVLHAQRGAWTCIYNGWTVQYTLHAQLVHTQVSAALAKGNWTSGNARMKLYWKWKQKQKQRPEQQKWKPKNWRNYYWAEQAHNAIVGGLKFHDLCQ